MGPNGRKLPAVLVREVAMVNKGIRRLPVVDDGAPMGTLSRSDICRVVIYHS
jgi:CBS domain-containing protein